jgi:mRNA-degrading endonuclease RelE of RelBE toxin-antitoxin system
MFNIKLTPLALKQLEKIKKREPRQGLLKQITKTIRFLSENPRHPSLNTHKNQRLSNLHGLDIFQVYAQNYTSGAYRIFFTYSAKDEITITSIEAHPD